MLPICCAQTVALLLHATCGWTRFICLGQFSYCGSCALNASTPKFCHIYLHFHAYMCKYICICCCCIQLFNTKLYIRNCDFLKSSRASLATHIFAPAFRLSQGALGLLSTRLSIELSFANRSVWQLLARSFIRPPNTCDTSDFCSPSLQLTHF